MAHHHLAIAVIFIVAGHMYRTNFGIGHSIKEILNAHKPPPLAVWVKVTRVSTTP
jgi:photosystem I P700 chlorophyll a apoprotein A2